MCIFEGCKKGASFNTEGYPPLYCNNHKKEKRNSSSQTQKEKIKKYHKDYFNLNRDKITDRNRDYRKNNREKELNRHKKYRVKVLFKRYY
jgi:hypothetical protein